MRQQAKSVELPKVKRVLDSWDGKVIDYLLSHPSKRNSPELILEALSAYYLVEALEGKVSDEEFRQACREAIENLSKKLASIQRMAGLNTITSVPSFTEAIPEIKQLVSPLPQQQGQEDDEDIWNMDIQLSEEMMDVNEAIVGVDS